MQVDGVCVGHLYRCLHSVLQGETHCQSQLYQLHSLHDWYDWYVNPTGMLLLHALEQAVHA